MEQQKIKEILQEAMEAGRSQIPHGTVATYIPQLGTARKDALGLCLSMPDGSVYKEGDADTRFTIQSISKVVSLCKALELRGEEEVFCRVGMEPSGEAFIPQERARNGKLISGLRRRRTSLNISRHTPVHPDYPICIINIIDFFRCLQYSMNKANFQAYILSSLNLWGDTSCRN